MESKLVVYLSTISQLNSLFQLMLTTCSHKIDKSESHFGNTSYNLNRNLLPSSLQSIKTQNHNLTCKGVKLGLTD
jgi:hypothetical protein